MPDKITKFIESLDKKTKAKLKEKLIALKQNPFGMKGVKKIQGVDENMYRLRIGKIRVIYRVHDDKLVEIIDIDYRGNIY
ncbi:type II toxin-antitoxin system RelE/ParE family toxin [Candidatus Peregrinibacteria bacterium]|nr:type II toxin-antitoxin system RelE/ParE family toxin [Candidatus Peregrinibacteria bacterium]